MSQTITKRENYKLGSGLLYITASSDDINISDITIDLNGAQVVNVENEISHFNIGATDELLNDSINVLARISRTKPGSFVSLTIELKDDTKSRVYSYPTTEIIDEDVNIIFYEVNIKLK